MSRETILIVEDDALNRDLLYDILSQESYNILLADSGHKALEIFQREREEIGLIIIDMNMPGMNGKETIHAIKKVYPDVKIILTTGYELNGAVSEAFPSGVAAFVKKPFRINTLISTVRKVLERGGEPPRSKK